MATASFRVYSHWMARGPALEVPQGAEPVIAARGCIGLLGEDGYRLFLYFLDDGDVAPSGTWSDETLTGTTYLPLSPWADYESHAKWSSVARATGRG